MDELWRQTVETRLIAAETRNAVDEVHRQNVEMRLGSIEDILKWLVRLILGALVLAILGVAFKSGINLT
ncbi:pseudouridine synthase [Oceaniovalibus sp. ACAM 378]|uniref:pseudouridine synthase n=1 Tax=Oceaniovalibus sp. ACAM 378 TaxID=2599923 RepID=UPI0011D3BE9C|nr:pseudouridine synthase [Oceaniovalibus sp. ACAM 378]TYB90292.1 pseudouridine synthase [Oceaniovalibus sp. ACAM 378]